MEISACYSVMTLGKVSCNFVTAPRPYQLVSLRGGEAVSLAPAIQFSGNAVLLMSQRKPECCLTDRQQPVCNIGNSQPCCVFTRGKSAVEINSKATQELTYS